MVNSITTETVKAGVVGGYKQKMAPEEMRKMLSAVKSKLLAAYHDAEKCATVMEEFLDNDANLAENKAYGEVCQILGMLEEMITSINNQLNKLK